MKRASNLSAGALSSYRTGLQAYDPDKLGLGPLMVQVNGGGDGSFVGPMPIAVVRPMEASTAIPLSFPCAMQWSNKAASQWDWIFAADVSAAAVTRRLGMFRLDRLTGTATYDGFVTVTFPGTSEAKTIRGLRLDYKTESVGTVGVSGTALTGVATQFLANKVCVGNRIGFGSTDPDIITQWYEISAIASDTGITLTTNAGTISAGSVYVIEDLRLAMIVTSVTTNLGGLYLVKGLRRELFSSGGGVVPAAVSTDSIRACYFLKDAATGTALASMGGAMEDPLDASSRYMWVLETLANPVMFKFNIRAALTVATGYSTNAFVFKTGAGGVLTGAASQLNNGRLAQAFHGPGSGKDCIYFTTATRIYRTAEVSTITTGSTVWLIDNMTEVPPGGVSTYALGGGMQAIEYSGFIDRFVVTTTGASGTRSYITQYRTDGGQMDRIILADFKQIDQGSADASITPFPSINASPMSAWIEGGMAYLARFGITAIINQMWCVPLGADWEFAASTGSRVIFPRLSTQGASKFVQAFFTGVEVLGGATGKNLGMSPQPIRMYYRTGGISDNSGGWNLLTNSGDMSGVGGADYVQFMAEYRMDNTMIPGRLLNVGAIFLDSSMSDNWQGSSDIGTNITTKTFGFRQSVAYGTAVPRLTVQLFDAESGVSLGSDDSVTKAWTWEKTTNAGGAWGAYNTTDRANADTYVRVTPTSLADNIKVRAVIREY